jgi:MATE family multidrug resistance protein
VAATRLGYTAPAMPTLRSLVNKLLGLAWPVALSRLGIMGMGVVDAVVIGQLAPSELPHQALGWAPTAVVLVAGMGLLTGVQVLAARALGEGNPTHAGAVLRRGLVLGFVTGCVAALALALGGARVFELAGIPHTLAEPAARTMLVFTYSVPLSLVHMAGASFLEAVQKPLPSTWLMWAANVVNLGLNLLLVPDHGAVGSAWATVGARGFLALSLLAYIFFMPDADHYGVRRVRPGARGPGYRALLGVGLAAALSQAAEAGAFSGMTFLAGRIGEAQVAAYQITLNLLAVVFMLSLGMATATAVLASEAVGQGQPRTAARVGFTGLGLNSAGMLLCAAAIVLLREAIGRAYTADAQLAQVVSALLPLVALVLVPDGGQTVTASALRAQGDNWFPTGSHLLAYALVMPALGYWLGEHEGQGVAGLLSAILMASALSAGILVLRLGWLRKKNGRLVEIAGPRASPG